MDMLHITLTHYLVLGAILLIHVAQGDHGTGVTACGGSLIPRLRLGGVASLVQNVADADHGARMPGLRGKVVPVLGIGLLSALG